MYFAHTALAATCFVVLVNGQGESDVANDGNVADNEDDAKDVALIDNHTFVALIDIVFTDGSKRTCTGSIVHDNVVITAAHCFKVQHNRDVKPEMTASFVVIGTKTMFDTGYEQYLPIERVLTHPKYKGWTADLSLVYTFAGMTSDEPGTIIPLAGEKTSTHVDSNVTVLSWGHLTGDVLTSVEQKPPVPPPGHDYDDSCYSDEQEYDIKRHNKRMKKKRVTASLHKQLRNAQGIPIDHSYINSKEGERSPILKQKNKKKQKHRTDRSKNGEFEHDLREDVENLRSELSESMSIGNIERYHGDTERNGIHLFVNSTEVAEHCTEILKRFCHNDYIIGRTKILTGFLQDKFGRLGNNTKKSQARRHRKSKKNRNETPTRTFRTTVTTRKASRPKPTTSSSLELFKSQDKVSQKQKEPLALPQIFSFKSYYKNWRRQMGTQQNQLTVENFGFVNIQACKLLVEKAMPSEYDISKSNDVVCYASGDRFINDDDSGAPAIRHGALVAVTVGGAECDGDHVAIGMKMSCYCSWISDNLPSGGKDMNCCNNCCDVKHKEEITNERRHKFKNKYL